MQYSIKSGVLEKQRTDCLLLGIHENHQLTPPAQAIDRLSEGFISKILARGDIEGKVGDTLLLPYVPNSKADRVLLVGLGEQDGLDIKDYRKALGAAIKALKASGAQNALCTFVETQLAKYDSAWKMRQAVEVFEDGLYQFTRLKSEKEEEASLAQIQFFLADEEELDQAEQGLKQGQAIVQGIKLAKDLGNLPGNICTPRYLAEEADNLGKTYPKLKVKILDEEEMEKLGMGALLSVSRGSRQPAKLIVMEYLNASGKDKPIILIGKGITFDAGGISLKPAEAMDEMKYDMGGGASVLGALCAVAMLDLPLNVVGLIPASENLPDGNANKPGDIVTSMSGKTIEILNTDAEGRLVLCDALTYAERYQPAAVIDIATLTGACVVALGKHPSGLWGNDDSLCNALIEAGEQSFDRVWRLPLWEEYQEQLKSNFADITNMGSRDGSAITAARFLSCFAEKFKWAHLDIAGTAWKSGKEKGATGRPVALLMQYLLNQTQ